MRQRQRENRGLDFSTDPNNWSRGKDAGKDRMGDLYLWGYDYDRVDLP